MARDDALRRSLDVLPGPEVDPPVPPHARGTRVVLRSIRELPGRGPTVSFAVAGTVLHDDGELFVLMTRPGSGRAARAGAGIGPQGRLVSATDWDGRYDVAVWEGETVVRVHRRGERWSVWRWHDGTDWTRRWYGNLETPWRRTAIGYDTRDWALDVVADGVPGTADWQVAMKDEDELAWFVGTGALTPEQAAAVSGTGARLHGLLSRGEGAAGISWEPWIPPDDIGPHPLPEGWQRIPGPERPS